MNIRISGLYQYLFLGLQYHLQAPDQGWTLQRKEDLTTKGGRSQPSGSFLMDGLGWCPAHTTGQTHPKLRCPNQPHPKKPCMEEACKENKSENNLGGKKLQVLPRSQVRTLFPCLPQVRALCSAERGCPTPPAHVLRGLRAGVSPPGPVLNACHPDCGGREITGERRDLLRRHQMASEQG